MDFNLAHCPLILGAGGLRQVPSGRSNSMLGRSNSMLQQSPLQLQLGLAADAPIDLRGWGYGDPRNDAGDN